MNITAVFFILIMTIVGYINGLLLSSKSAVFHFESKEEHHKFRMFFSFIGLVISLFGPVIFSKSFILIVVIYFMLLGSSILRYLAMKHNFTKVKTNKTLYGYEVFSEESLSHVDKKYYVYVENEEDLKNFLNLVYERVTILDESRFSKEILETMLDACLSEKSRKTYQHLVDLLQGHSLSFQLDVDRQVVKVFFNTFDQQGEYQRVTFGVKFVEKDINGNYMLSNWVDVTTFLEEYY